MGTEAISRRSLDLLASLQVADRLGITFKSLSNPTVDKPAAGWDLLAWARAGLLGENGTYFPLSVSRVPTSAESEPHLKELNDNLQLASLFYAPDVNYWLVGGQQKLAANHAKVYIIDDTHFYVGSDNVFVRDEDRSAGVWLSDRGEAGDPESLTITGTSSGRITRSATPSRPRSPSSRQRRRRSAARRLQSDEDKWRRLRRSHARLRERSRGGRNEILAHRL